jgi:dihydrofolate reductase
VHTLGESVDAPNQSATSFDPNGCGIVARIYFEAKPGGVVFVGGGGRVFAQSVGDLCDELKFVHLLGLLSRCT